jgi:hypothetical protein
LAELTGRQYNAADADASQFCWTVTPTTINRDVTNGCTTCFLYYLQNQLGFSNAIIAAAGPTLANDYRNLTGKSYAWQSFISLVNTFYPPGITYNPSSDAIFPVAHLSNLDNADIISGASMNEQILSLDTQALAEVVVSLSSDNPAILSVSPNVTLQPGTWATRRAGSLRESRKRRHPGQARSRRAKRSPGIPRGTRFRNRAAMPCIRGG